jgi:hypothetical protein
MKIMRNIQEHEIVTRDVPQTTLKKFQWSFFLYDNGMFLKEVKILVIRLLDLSIVGFEVHGYGVGGGGMVTYQANPKLLGLGRGATQGDKGMGTKENIIECM